MSLLDGLKSLSRPRPRRDRSFWLDDNRVVSCYECDTPFTLLNRKHHCRACGRIFCSNCTTSCVLEDGLPPERVCNFCQRLHSESSQIARHEKLVRQQDKTYKPPAQSSRRGPPSSSRDLPVHTPITVAAASSDTNEVRTSLHNSTKAIRDPALTWDVPPPLRQSTAVSTPKQDGVPALSAKRESLSARKHRQEAASPPHHKHAKQQQAFAQVSQQHLSAVVQQLLDAEGIADTLLWQPVVTHLAREAAEYVQPSALAAFGVADPRYYIKVKRLPDVGSATDSKVVNGLVFRKNVVHKLMKSHIVQPRVMLLGSMLEYHRTSGKLSSFDTLLEQEHAHLRNTVDRIAEYKPNVLLVEKSVARYAQELLLKKGISVVLNVKRTSLLRLARCTEAQATMILQVASSVEDINNHCIAFCKEFKVEVLHAARSRVSAPGNNRSGNASDDGHIVSPIQSPCLKRTTGSTGSADSASSQKQSFSGPRTLMYFKECPRPLGCTILLYGADAGQLQLLKKVMKFAVYVAYANRLEDAFLADEMAAAQATMSHIYYTAPHPEEQPEFMGYLATESAVATSAAVASQSGACEPIVSASPHVPRYLSKDATSSMLQSQAGQIGTVTSASAASPVQSAAQPASPSLEQQHQHPKESSYPRAHRQLFKVESALNGQHELPQPQQLDKQRGQCVIASPRQSAGDSSVYGDQTRLRGLQLYSRQRLYLCKLCHNPSRGLLCEPSTMQRIEFYKGSDVPLASFVAASAPHKCPHPACGDGVASHLRTFLHNKGRITLSVNQTAPGKELPGADKGQVWFWARPLHVSPASMPTTWRVPVSSEALCLSFGHFLELSFGAHQLKVDDKDLHGDFVRYLGMGSTILCFHYEAISPNTVQIPARHVCTQRAAEHTWLHREVDDLTKEAEAAFAAVQSALQTQLEQGSLAPDLAPAGDIPTASSMIELMTAAKDEQAAFEGMLRDVTGLLTPVSDLWLEHAQPSETDDGVPLEGTDEAKRVPTYVTMLWELGRLRRSLAVLVMTWAATLHDPVVYARPISHSHSVPTSLHSAQDSGPNRHLSTESLPELHDVSVRRSIDISEHHVSAHETAYAHDAADGSTTVNSTPDNDATSTIDSCDSPKAQQPDPLIALPAGAAQQQDNSDGTGPEAVDNKPARTASLPAVSKGIVAQTIRQLERRESERTTPTRLNAAAAARRYLASALQQRARTLQWLDSSKLSSDETVLRLGEPISQLAYLEVHLHVSETEYVTCRLVRRTQHARALQALGLKKNPDSADSNTDSDEEPSARTPIKLIPSDEPDAGAAVLKSGSNKAPVDQMAVWNSQPPAAQEKPDHYNATTGAALAMSSDPGVDPEPRSDAKGTLGVGAETSQNGAAHQPAETAQNKAAHQSPASPKAVSSQQGNTAVESGHSPAATASSSSWPTAIARGPSASVHDSGHRTTLRSGAQDSSMDTIMQEHMARLQLKDPAAPDEHAANSPHGLAPPNRMSSDASALISHFDHWANVLDPEAETPLSRRGSGKLHGLEPDMLRSTVDGLLKRQTVPSQLQSIPGHSRVTGSMSTAPSLSHKQMGQIMSAGSGSYKQTALQPNAIPLVHGKVDLKSRALLASGAQDIVVPVYDEEPTSIITYALASRLYQTFLKESAERIKAKPAVSKTGQSKPASVREAGLRAAIMAPLTSHVAVETEPLRHTAGDDLKPKSSHSSFSGFGWRCEKGGAGVESSSSSFKGVQGSPGADSKDGDAPVLPPHMVTMLCEDRMDFQHVFEDAVPGMPSARATFQVTAYYAPQFDALRKLIVEGGQLVFLACLSRCKKWVSQGGKSNVYFAKTRDERYVVKQLTRSEKQSFLDFAPAYFRYLSNTYSKDQDTCLAKVLGLFQVSKKSTGAAAGTSGKPLVMDLLVMENVLYATNTSRIYDLKGSERSRWSQEDPAQSGSVLMDDNLRENNLTQPILVDQAAHAHLEAVLWRDTAFLAGLGVMDYSLLVGLEPQQHRLVVGIIDFIRQYTWDKQLETWVKSSVMLGGTRKEPTVISPKQYCRRFRVAISSYFVSVPSAEQALPSLDPDALM